MKLPEAIVYLIATSGCGLKVDQITDRINLQKLCTNFNGSPISLKQVYYTIMKHPEIFVKEDGRIRLTI